MAQFAITYVPALQTVFGTQAVPFGDGLLIVGLGVVFFGMMEVEKQMRLTFRYPARIGLGRGTPRA